MTSGQEQHADTKKLNEHIQATKKEIIRLWEDRENSEIPLNENIRKLASQVEETGCPKQFVSSEIIRMFSARDRLQRYIADVLDSTYKNKYTKEQIVQGRTDSIEECSIESEQIIEILKKAKNITPEDIGRRDFQEVSQLIHEIKNNIELVADSYNIPLPYTKSKLDDASKEKIGLKRAELPDNELAVTFSKILSKEYTRAQNDLEELRKTIQESQYVPDNSNVVENTILGLRAIRLLIKPYVDKKWQRDWLEWCDIIENYFDQGGTYASTKSAVDVAEEVNPKTGQPVRRKITKEQIDAKYIEYLNEMRFMIKMLPNHVKSKVILDVDYQIDINTEKVVISRGSKLDRKQLEKLHPEILENMRFILNGIKWIGEP